MVFFKFLTIFLSFIFVFRSFASELVLPLPSGPYKVGTKALEFHDDSRQALRGKAKHKWMVQAFYPINIDRDEFFPYMPDTLKKGMIQFVRIFSHSHSFLDISKKGPFPVIIFIPGFGNVRQNYTILCEELASYGYAVFSFDQPYVSNFVRFLDGSVIVPQLYDVWKSKTDRDYRYRYFDQAMDYSIKDIQFFLNHLSDLSKEKFQNHLNNQKICLMGHSFGGNVAHTSGLIDSRIPVIIDIDSKITERSIFGRVGIPPNLHHKPTLFIRASLQYQEEVEDQLAKIDKATVLNFSVQHSAFTDNAFLADKVKRLKSDSFLKQLWKWFFKISPPFILIDINIDNIDSGKWFNSLNASIVKWLQRNF